MSWYGFQMETSISLMESKMEGLSSLMLRVYHIYTAVKIVNHSVVICSILLGPLDPCERMTCNRNSICVSNSSTTAECTCMPGYSGDPEIGTCLPDCEIDGSPCPICKEDETCLKPQDCQEVYELWSCGQSVQVRQG